MKVYGKVYGKQPPGAKRKQAESSVDSGGRKGPLERREHRALSLIDLKLSPSPSGSTIQELEVSGRKNSAPGQLVGIRAKAKVIHQPALKPKSATPLRNRNSSSGCESSSSKSTPSRTLKRVTIEQRASVDDDDLSSPPPLSILASPFPGELTHDDELLLSQSDELCREVLSLCDVHNSDFPVSLRPPSRCEVTMADIISPTAYMRGTEHDGSGDSPFNITGQELTSLPCMPLLSSLASTPMVTARGTSPTGEIDPALKSDKENRKLQYNNDVPSGPPTATPPQTPSPEYDYGKVFGILRMIEDEEAKASEIASCFETFLKEKYLESPKALSIHTDPGDIYVPPMSAHSSAGRVQLECKVSPEFLEDTARFRQGTSERSLPTARSSSLRGHSLQGNETPPLFSSRSDNTRCTDKLFDEIKSQHRQFLPVHNEEWETERNGNPGSSRSSHISEPWEASEVKSQTLFSYLDEVEQSDRDKLFNLKFKQGGIDAFALITSPGQGQGPRRAGPSSTCVYQQNSEMTTASKLDTLIRKGSAELAREIMMLERQLEDSAHNVHILEETLISQRELNIRNMKNSEKDSKKRLKLQQEEFELTVSRHQAFVDQLIVEKRSLQEKCEKILKDSKETEEKYQQQVKSLQEKHLEEIKRLRKVQENVEKNKKQKWVGQKTQEIRDMTVKGLEPEVQRLIQRHQQEMAETRAYYADEIQEIDERYARKQTHQLQELRENFSREKEEACRRERDLVQIRFESEFQRQLEELETQKRRWLKDVQEKDRMSAEEVRIKELAQENVRKGQIKCEVEVENIRQEHELKISQLEKRHEREIQSLRDNFESQRENWITTFNKKNEQILAERESQLIEILNKEKEKEIREREKKFKEDFERIREEESTAQEARIKRLQEKFQSELEELEKSEHELKVKFTAVKAEVIAKEEELFSVRTTLGLRTKENQDLTEANMRMLEERVNLTSIIRREFTAQIEALEEDCGAVKSAVIELKSKHKLDLEMNQLNFEKFRTEKDAELERIGQRVKQTLARKEETLIELGKQLEKSQIRVNHLELLLEQQRKDFVKSMTTATGPSTKKK